METFTSTDAKREFGEMLLKSQQSPVGVTRNGKPIAVIMSDHEYRELKLQALRAAITDGDESSDVKGFSIEDIKRKLDAE